MEKNITDVLDGMFGSIPPPSPSQSPPPRHDQHHTQTSATKLNVRHDAVTGAPMESIDIPNGNGGFVNVDYCKSTGGWFLDKNELSALRAIPGIGQVIQTISSN
jgi:hypothetical protein